MEELLIHITKDKVTVGTSPQLVINLKDQKNYIKLSDREIPYRKEILLSPDLLAGKRKQVLQTALRYYYTQACQIAEDMKIAEKYRKEANTTIREK